MTINPGDSDWPSNYQGCTITGRFVDVTGTPLNGKVHFTPAPKAVHNAAQNVIIVGKRITVNLDASGSFSVTLPATDDPDINPVGWTYTVFEDFTGGRTYSISAPQNTTVDLADVAPVDNNLGTAIVRGEQGDKGDKGDKGDTGDVPYEDVETAVLDALTTYSPGMELGYAQRTTAYSSTASSVITALSVTVVGKGRPVDVEFYCSRVYHTTTGAFMQARLLSNGTQINQSSDITPHVTAGSTLNTRQRMVLADGVSYTFTVYGFMGSAGTMTFDAAADRPMWLSVVSR